MDKRDFILETDIELDDRDGLFECKCYDGYAICEEYDGNTKVVMTYPTLAEVVADEDLCDKILEYRGLYDLKAKDIHFGDVMIVLGEAKAMTDGTPCTEWCPHCDTEVELKGKLEVQPCPNCGEMIYPCNLCLHCTKDCNIDRINNN